MVEDRRSLLKFGDLWLLLFYLCGFFDRIDKVGSYFWKFLFELCWILIFSINFLFILIVSYFLSYFWLYMYIWFCNNRLSWMYICYFIILKFFCNSRKVRYYLIYEIFKYIIYCLYIFVLGRFWKSWLLLDVFLRIFYL